eukprot:755079-Rhodomonas_salina.1
MQAAAQGGAAASEVRGARQQQLEEEDEEPSMEDGDEDMFPETESESYAEQEPEGDIVPHKVVYNYNYAAPQYGPSPPEQAAQTAPSSPLAKDPMQQPGSLVKPVPNFFVSPFQRSPSLPLPSFSSLSPVYPFPACSPPPSHQRLRCVSLCIAFWRGQQRWNPVSPMSKKEGGEGQPVRGRERGEEG